MDYQVAEQTASDSCLALGRFDGLNRGHMAVVKELIHQGRERGLRSVLVCLEEDAPGKVNRLLTTEDEKRLILEEEGPDRIDFLPGGNARDPVWLEELVKANRVRLIVTGPCQPGLEMLEARAGELGYRLLTCPTFEVGGEAVTHERTLEALAASDFDRLTDLLGRPYFIYGKVVHGKQLGRTVGMPTANIDYPVNKYLPEDGVYGTITTFGGRAYMGMTNIGRRPSVDSFDYVTVENYLLDFSGDLYGQKLRMDIHAKVRGVKRFDSLEEVRAQVEIDLKQIRETLEERFRAYPGAGGGGD